MVDRREFLRYNCLNKIDLFTRDGTLIHGVTCNISERGLQVHTPCPLPEKGAFFGLLELIDPKTQDLIQVRLRLRVIYCVHDGQTLDFRSGLHVQGFIGDGDRIFQDVLEAQTQLWDGELYEPILHQQPSETYILTRKVRIRDDSQWFTAWSQRLSNSLVIIVLEEPQPLNYHYDLLLPVVLPESNTRRVLKISTEVFGIVLNGSGQYDTFLRFVDINEDDKEFLNEELRQRFGANIPAKSVPLADPDDLSFFWP